MPETATAPQKPIPVADEASEPFFQGAMEGRLMIMRCTSCGTARIPSRTHCDNCLSPDFTWEQASGRGKVHTFAIMHQKYHPAFFDELPYNLAMVELDEGPRLSTNIVGAKNADIRVGMSVVVDFEKYDDVALPKFRPA
jgi:uncharacterized protein